VCTIAGKSHILRAVRTSYRGGLALMESALLALVGLVLIATAAAVRRRT
jgi:hypothetical protein